MGGWPSKRNIQQQSLMLARPLNFSMVTEIAMTLFGIHGASKGGSFTQSCISVHLFWNVPMIDDGAAYDHAAWMSSRL